MQNESVKLRTAFTWNCPECGEVNFAFIATFGVMCDNCNKLFTVTIEAVKIGCQNNTN